MSEYTELEFNQPARNIRINLKPQEQKTSIVVSRDTREKLIGLGKYGESYDDILEKLIDYDIELEKKRKEVS